MTDHADQYRVLIGELDDAVNTPIPHAPPPVTFVPQPTGGPRIDWGAVVFALAVVLFLILYLQHG